MIQNSFSKPKHASLVECRFRFANKFRTSRPKKTDSLKLHAAFELFSSDYFIPCKSDYRTPCSDKEIQFEV